MSTINAASQLNYLTLVICIYKDKRYTACSMYSPGTCTSSAQVNLNMPSGHISRRTDEQLG